MLLRGAVPLVSGDRRKFGQMKSRGGKSKRREEKRREKKRREEKKREEKRREGKGRGRGRGRGRGEEEEEEEEEKKKKKRREEKEDQKKRKSQKKEDPGARKGRKVAKHYVFPMICGSGRKIAPRCGAKHISKSECTKHTRFGPLLEVEMSKKCTPLWRKAHFEVKMYKAQQLRTTFGSWDVEKVHAVVAQSTFRSQKCQKLRGSEHFWTFKCRFAWQAQGIVHLVKSEQNVKSSGLLKWFCVTGAALRMTRYHFFVAGAVV